MQENLLKPMNVPRIRKEIKFDVFEKDCRIQDIVSIASKQLKICDFIIITLLLG